MTDEQIERVLRLVRDYGDCLSVSMESDRYLSGRELWQGRAEAVYERIEAELKGGGTE